MTFYETLDSIMKQDFGGRGLLASLPASPLAAVYISIGIQQVNIAIGICNYQFFGSLIPSYMINIKVGKSVCFIVCRN